MDDTGMVAGVIAGLYVAANLIAASLFWLDKKLAEDGSRLRISERALLNWAFLGWPGAKVAQQRFRHKTRKQPFVRIFNALVVAHGLLVAALAWLAMSGSLSF